MTDLSHLSADDWDEIKFPRPDTNEFDDVVERALSRRGFLSGVVAFGSGAAVMGTGVGSLQLDGAEQFDVLGLGDDLKAQQELTLRIIRADGADEEVPVLCRIDTDIEVEYYRHGGILSYVLRQLVARG